MSLKRFPWKLPRTSDVSYKYFVAEPTPGTPSVVSLRRRASNTEDTSAHDGHHEHHHSSNGTASTASSQTPSDAANTPQQSLRGPWRLLRLLPRESRYVIGRMLDTNPEKRASLEEIYAEPWLQRECCSQDETGQVHRMTGHDHVLEPGAGGGSEAKK